MGMVYLLSLIAALATVAGGMFVVFRVQHSTIWLRSFLAFGAGFLLAAGVIAMIPEAFEAVGPQAALLVLAGYLVTHLFEHALVPHFHFGEERHTATESLSRRSFLSATVGMLVHSLFDGVAIGSGFVIDPALGWLLFLAIVLHKLPDGFTVASLALASQQSGSSALAAVILLGMATILGTTLVTLATGWAAPALAVAAGVAIYVAATDLMPEVNRERNLRWSLLFFAGVAAFYLGEHLLHGLQP